MNIKITFISILFFLGNPLFSQSYHTVLSTGYSYASPTLIPDKSNVSLFYLRASVPVKLKSGDYLLLNPDLHRQLIGFSSAPQTECYKTGLTTAYMKMKKKGNIIGVMNLSNNFEKGHMGIHSMQIGAGVLATRKINARLKLKMGLYCNREFFSPLIVPLFGIDYKIAPAIRLFGVLPQNMRLEFKHQKNFRSVLLFESPLNTYRTSGQTDSRYIDQRQILAGFAEDIYLSKHMVLQVSFKYPVANSQRLFNGNQTYNANIWGMGIGGERAANSEAIATLKHSSIIECSFNYRIEVE